MLPEIRPRPTPGRGDGVQLVEFVRRRGAQGSGFVQNGNFSGRLRCISFGLSLVLTACSNTKPSEPAPTRELTGQVDAGVQDGEVRLGPASQAYVRVEAVSMEPEHAVIRAPARVAFRDGAVSKVGAPIPPGLKRDDIEERVYQAINALN